MTASGVPFPCPEPLERVITAISLFVAGDHRIELRAYPGCRIKVSITDSDVRPPCYPQWWTAEVGTPASNTKGLHV
ncbi:hypothetical protein GCM10027258_01940 [Amycolatopsis stemonae]